MMKNKFFLYSLSAFILCIMLSNCAIVRSGEVGVKQRFGKIIGKEKQPGMYAINFFTTKIVKVPTRTINMPVKLNALPSKEGLSIDCELAVLFHVKPDHAVSVVENVGVRYGEGIILSALRSATADVTAQFLAKDLHTSERFKIENAISQRLTKILGDRGFVVEAVLLKSIRLPANLSAAIEDKLRAEQEAQTMKFILQREKQEAERLKIEAEGIRDYQRIISEGLSEMIIKYKSLEVFEKLSNSPNSKVIITNGKTPMLIDE